jgi:hypothetical protein
MILPSHLFIPSSRLLQFLFDCGARPARSDDPHITFISRLLGLAGFLEGEHEIGGHLFDLYGYNLVPPRSLAQKEGLRWLTRQSNDGMHLPRTHARL